MAFGGKPSRFAPEKFYGNELLQRVSGSRPVIRQLIGHTAAYTFANIVSRGTILVWLIFLPAFLSTAEYGVLGLIMTTAALVNVLVPLEVTQGYARYYPTAPDREKRSYAATASTFTLAALAAPAGAAWLFAPWLNGLLLWGAFTSFSLAVSASFDRPGPAIGLSLAFLLVNYFLEILGSLWTDAKWTQEYSLFHHFQPGEILAGNADPLDFVLLGVVLLVPLAYALWIFPRRDLAAPA